MLGPKVSLCAAAGSIEMSFSCVQRKHELVLVLGG